MVSLHSILMHRCMLTSILTVLRPKVSCPSQILKIECKEKEGWKKSGGGNYLKLEMEFQTKSPDAKKFRQCYFPNSKSSRASTIKPWCLIYLFFWWRRLFFSFRYELDLSINAPSFSQLNLKGYVHIQSWLSRSQSFQTSMPTFTVIIGTNTRIRIRIGVASRVVLGG